MSDPDPPRELRSLFEQRAFLASYLAEVVAVDDPDQRTRVKIRLLGSDGVGDHDGPLWARVAVPFAGAKRGAFFLPDVGDEVLVVFQNGDPRLPLVIGGLWNGAARAPEQLGGSNVDRWTIVGKAGTRIAIVEQSAADATIQLSTPGGVTAKFTDSGGGVIELSDPSGNSIKLSPSGIEITASAKVTVNAAQVNVSAGMVTVDAGMSKFSGVVQCDTLIATTVVASTYTPGAGNIW